MKKSELYKILDELDFHPGKVLGQNFLVDDNFLDFIVRLSNPQKGDRVLEVGPGFAALTRHLLASGADLTCIEFDHRIAEYLRKKITADNFRLIQSDVMKVDLEAEVAKGQDFRCIANLPYAVSSPFIGNLIDLELPPRDMYFMLQKEMGQRLAAKIGTKNYGALSVRVQLCYDVDIARVVPKHVFHPPPDVDSAIVRFIRREEVPSLEFRREFSKIVRAGFSQRRKQMFKHIAPFYGKEKTMEAYESCGVKKTARAEELTVDKFKELVETLMA